MNNSKLKNIVIFAAIGVAVFVIIVLGLSLTKNIGKDKDVVSTETAMQQLEKEYNKINVNTLDPVMEPIELEGNDAQAISDSLPEIEKYPAGTENTTPDYIEIFSSTEKATEGGSDAWLLEVAENFNNEGFTVNDKPVSVRVRGLASGMAADYIASGKYVPDAYTPSNKLWGQLLEAKGVELSLVEERLAGNVAGVLTSKETYNELVSKYGSVSINTVTEAVKNGELSMGYTNPYASSTGLNFLISSLASFDPADPLSTQSMEAFESFQSKIAAVAYTTLQMRDAASAGSLDGFVLEYQLYENEPELKSSYVFSPFGYRHDSPVYAIGTLSDEKQQILDKFIEYCKNEESQELANKYGFNKLDEYKEEVVPVGNEVLPSALKLWKEKKDSVSGVIAVFVADVSGSMDGDPLNRLKESLSTGASYINKDCSVGIVTFSDDVNIALPIAKFDANQRSYFNGAVNSMVAGGGTAMFDAITVATKMLVDAQQEQPNAKLMLFVLSDGEANRGSMLNDIQGYVRGLKIPIYTIGYNANIEVLGQLSALNEAASINADTDDVVYKLGSLFNAQM